MSARKLPLRLSDKAQIIPFDAPGEDGATREGIYLEPLGLPWLIEDLSLSIKGSRALVAALGGVSALGVDSLPDDYWSHALSTIEDQLSRAAAIADHAVTQLLANGGES